MAGGIFSELIKNKFDSSSLRHQESVPVKQLKSLLYKTHRRDAGYACLVTASPTAEPSDLVNEVWTSSTGPIQPSTPGRSHFHEKCVLSWRALNTQSSRTGIPAALRAALLLWSLSQTDTFVLCRGHTAVRNALWSGLKENYSLTKSQKFNDHFAYCSLTLNNKMFKSGHPGFSDFAIK